MSGIEKKRGLFITLEGGEGAGKSTQLELLSNYLEEKNVPVISTREPGGTPGAEVIRHVILSGAAEEFGSEFEALMFTAARLDHIDLVIAPALKSNKVVICDRFIDSTRVYQKASDEQGRAYITALEETVRTNAWPDVTFILDIEPENGFKRVAKRNNKDDVDVADRFEKEDLAVQKERRDRFLSIAKAEPDRCVVIDASRKAEKVHEEIRNRVEALLELHKLAKRVAS